MKSLSASSSIIGGLFLLAILFYIIESNHGVHLSDLPSRGATRPEKIVSRSDSADHVPYSTVASKKPTIPIVGRENHSNIPSVPVIPFTAWESHANVHSSKPFERVNCPDEPAPGYPIAYQMLKILENWNVDNTDIPPVHYDSICHFDYQNPEDNKKAWTYRSREVPFVVYNIPEVDAVVSKWSDMDYLKQRLGSFKYDTTTSESNHFMYFQGRRGGGRDWKPPTQSTKTKFPDWLRIAEEGQNKSLADRQHQYFRASSTMGQNWLFDEMPFYRPKKSLLMKNPSQQQGIHCRFGMRGIIAEAHFDGGRNVAAIMTGLRRWILTHPNQCEHMHMYQQGHPSARHSQVDWSKPDIQQFPNFPKVMGNEVILQPGDVLYAPIYWIHYIVSLNVNIQCNTRSGKSNDFDEDLKRCGFEYHNPKDG